MLEPHPFDRGIALEALGNARYRGVLDREWWIDFGPNGGFLASIMLHAITKAVADPQRHPCTLSVHYPGRAQEGEFHIVVSIDRAGRSTTFASARMYQDEKLLTSALCSLSSERTSAEFNDAPAPEVAPPEAIQELPAPPGTLPRFADHFDYRFALGALPFSGSEVAEVGGWIRPKEPRVVDALMIPTYADGFPPASFGSAHQPFPIPTLDLTVHFRAPLPLDRAGSGDFTLARFSSSLASGGFIEEDGLMWSRDGRLIAQSRQLALYGAPAS